MSSLTRLFLLALAAPAMASADSLMNDPLFLEDSVLNITLEAPWSRILEDRSTENSVPAVLKYKEDGVQRKLDITVRAYGNFRRKPENCDFPPIALGFEGSDNSSGLFRGQTKLRMVNHCKDRSERYEQLVAREYLAYRMFNLFTPLSYRARLLQVTYADPQFPGDSESAMAFVTEHESRMAHRNDLEFLDLPRINARELDGEYLNLTSLYQYFIGNTDFSPVAGIPGEPCCHNYAIYAAKDGRHLAIPYDFDWAGMVDAPYAVPNSQLGLRTVKQRLYRGRCINNDHLDGTLAAFREKRGDIGRLVDNTQGMTSSTRKHVMRYLDDFYDTIDHQKALERNIRNKCIN